MSGLRRWVFVVLAGWIVGLAGAAHAAPFTTAFDALAADLEARRANDYAPPLTAAQKKESRALDRSLARLAKPHDDVVDDVQSAAFVAKTLKSGFRREFSPATATSNLAGLVAGVFQSLVATVEADYGRLDDALDVVTDAADRAAATARLNKARKALDIAAAAATPAPKAAKQLQKALRAAQQGLAIAVPYVDGYFTALVSGRALVATEIQAGYNVSAGVLSFTATSPETQSSPRRTISIVVRSAAHGVHEIGAFDLFQGNYGLYYEGEPADQLIWYSQFGNGSVELTEFDTEHGRIAGRFAFVTMRNGNSTKKITKGKFVITGVVVE